MTTDLRELLRVQALLAEIYDGLPVDTEQGRIKRLGIMLARAVVVDMLNMALLTREEGSEERMVN